jgi:hypothetical protein
MPFAPWAGSFMNWSWSPPTSGPEGTVTTELRAALADLRHLQGFLGAVGQEEETASLAQGDTYLSRLAARQAVELARIGDQIEQAIGGEV